MILSRYSSKGGCEPILIRTARGLAAQASGAIMGV
jgi:hypothetical protein